MVNFEKLVCASMADMHAAALKLIREVINSSAERPSFALSGGSTPEGLYELMAGDPKVATALTYYFGDDRYVAQDDAVSNFRMAHEKLLKVVDPATYFPMVSPSGPGDIDEAALRYEEILKKTLPQVGGVPRFDVMLLGVGPDGHTASIFPGTPAVDERQRLVVPVMPPVGTKPYVPRLTVTRSVIAQSALIILLIAGGDKKWVVDGILADVPGERVPVARLLRECKGRVVLLLDTAADGSQT